MRAGLFLLALGAGLRASGPAAPAGSEYDVKAVFLYNFTRYLQWPAESPPEAFEIAVLGDSPILGPLREIARKRTVGPLPIVIRPCTEVGQIGRPRILFVAGSASRWLPRVVEATRDGGVLTVAEGEGMAASGAAVGFVLRDGAVKFEMNEAVLQKARLQASSQLLKLAIRVGGESPGADR